MKKFYLLAFAAILAATSCQKQKEFETGIPQGRETSMRVDISAPSYNADSRADEGQLTYYLEAFYKGKFFRDLGTSTTGHFDIRLVADKEFTLVAWADYANGAYNTEHLDSIAVQYTADGINDELRDAFAGSTKVTVTSNSTLEMVLQRPLARVNLIALDMKCVFGTKLMPETFTYTYNKPIYKAFNAVTGTPFNESTEDITYKKSVMNYTQVGDTTLVCFDYLLAPTTSKDDHNRELADMTFSLESQKLGVIDTYELTNIPYERNYQTNVYGNLITTGGVVKITVDEIWDNPTLEVK